jgi:predicted dehydrogenase
MPSAIFKLHPPIILAREMGHMAECVLRDQKPCTPGEERLRNMILMDAIYRAAKDRRSVSI